MCLKKTTTKNDDTAVNRNSTALFLILFIFAGRLGWWKCFIVILKSFQKINIYENILLMSAIQHSNNKKLSTVYVAPLKKHEGK